MSKKYFWLKLKEDFFRDKRMKKLRRIAGGDTYTIIYLKMQLLSLKNDGVLYFDDIEDTFHEEIALEIDEDAENVKVTIAFLMASGLVQESQNDSLAMLQTMESVGSETTGAARVRKHRQAALNDVKALQCNDLVTICNTEIEKEIEKELEIDMPPKIKKTKYGEFVTLSEKEYETLIEKHGEQATKSIIEILNNYKGANGKKYKSDYYAINNWVVKRYQQDHGVPKFGQPISKRPKAFKLDMTEGES